MVVPDGDDPLDREVEVAVPEWHLLPAMHGPQLRHASKDAPFRFIEPNQLADALLRPACKDMKINLSKLGTKTMAPMQGSIKYLTEQHTGSCCCLCVFCFLGCKFLVITLHYAWNAVPQALKSG